MRCDVDGTLYVARYGKGVIARVSPEGQVLGEVQVLGANPSNIAFGGTDGRTCYVTVADQRHVETFRVDRPGRSWWLFQQGRTEVTPGTWAQVKQNG
jgi:gluconolactonase